jgi:ribose 1,5-bisphosphokinase
MSTLFYVIGASGAGKDTLINYARTRINGSQPVIFAHRYITRPPFTGNENHISLSVAEFQSRLNANLFAMHWESHGYHYGIGCEINAWLGNGFNVVINGSREYLPVAQHLFPGIKAILIDVEAGKINERLIGRGREDPKEIEERKARSSEISADLSDCIKIQNDGTVEEAGDKLVDIITVTQKFYI